MAMFAACTSYDSSQVATDDMGLTVIAEVGEDGSLDVLAQLTVPRPGCSRRRSSISIRRSIGCSPNTARAISR